MYIWATSFKYSNWSVILPFFVCQVLILRYFFKNCSFSFDNFSNNLFFLISIFSQLLIFDINKFGWSFLSLEIFLDKYISFVISFFSKFFWRNLLNSLGFDFNSSSIFFSNSFFLSLFERLGLINGINLIIFEW